MLPMLPHAQAMMGHAPPATSQGTAINSAGMLKALKKRWVVAIIVGLLLGVTAGAGTWFLLPPARYSGEVIFNIDLNQPLLPVRESRADWVNYQRYQQTLLTNDDVLDNALAKTVDEVKGIKLGSYQPRVADDTSGTGSTVDTARKGRNDLNTGGKIKDLKIVQLHKSDVKGWLAKELKTDYQLGPNLLHVVLKENNREELSILLKAIAISYLEVASRKIHEQNEQNRTVLGAAIKRIEDQLESKRLRYGETLKTDAGSGGQTLTLQPEKTKASAGAAPIDANELRTRLVRVRDEIQKIELEKVDQTQKLNHAMTDLNRLAHKQDLKYPWPIANITGAVDKMKDAEIEGYERDIAQVTPLMKDLMGLRGYQRNPTYIGYKQKLERAQQGLAARRQQLGEAVARQVLGQAARQAQANLESLKQKEVYLSNKDKELTGLLRNVPISTASKKQPAAPTGKKTVSADAERQKREIDQLEGYRNQLDKQRSRLEVDAKDLLRAQAVDERILPSSDVKILAAASGAVGVLVFGMFAFGVSWVEFRRHRIDTADDVLSEVGLPLVGTIPEFNARRRALGYGRRAGVLEQAQQSILAESIDTCRTMLLHAARAESLRAVMIASAAPREGKTTLACQLATSLARAGRKTLLIDADLRKPMLYELYSVPNTPGLADVLRGETPVLEAVRETFVPGLWTLPAGQSDTQALQALSHEQFRRHLHRLKDEFDFVIIDSSPILSAVESLLLAQQADAVVFSILVEVSQVPAVQAAYRRLHMLGIRILGAVASGTATEQSTYGMTAYAYTTGSGTPAGAAGAGV